MVTSLCVLILEVVLLSSVHAFPPILYEGDVCKLGRDRKGLCKPLTQCEPALQQLRTSGIKPNHCSFKGFEEVVCCDDEMSQNLRRSEFACREYANELPLRVEPFIRNGRNADLGDYPHMAALGYMDPSEPSQIAWNCGGTLISDRYVLTAAHCVVPTTRTKPPVQIMLGAVNLNEPGFMAEKYHVKRWVQHPEYTTATVYNDIALIELDRKVQFSDDIQPACLYTASDIPQYKLEISGWGSTSSSGSRKSNILQHSTLSLVPNDKCNESYTLQKKVNKGIQDIMVCAGDPQGMNDTCNGDSGGPLQVKTTESNAYFIVGITSYGPSVCGGSTPGIYTRVNKYLDWIESIIWK